MFFKLLGACRLACFVSNLKLYFQSLAMAGLDPETAFFVNSVKRIDFCQNIQFRSFVSATVALISCYRKFWKPPWFPKFHFARIVFLFIYVQKEVTFLTVDSTSTFLCSPNLTYGKPDTYAPLTLISIDFSFQNIRLVLFEGWFVLRFFMPGAFVEQFKGA